MSVTVLDFSLVLMLTKAELHCDALRGLRKPKLSYNGPLKFSQEAYPHSREVCDMQVCKYAIYT